MPRTLSFCLTTYDKDYHLLPRVWESLRLQTDAPDEIIIVSSGLPVSPVQGGSVVIAGKGVPVYVANSSKRLTAAGARNFAGAMASKEIIQFFDGDDYLHQNHIQTTKAFFEKDNSAALLHTYLKSNNSISPAMSTPHPYDKSNLETVKWSKKINRFSVKDQIQADGVAAGPLAILSHVFESVKYRKHCVEDSDMLYQLLIGLKLTVKCYGFPLMTYFPANETGRPKMGSDDLMLAAPSEII